ncbi:hypothetical protein AAF712_010728 [Marasmius tenuissimus]|uniref:Uncharacterized protein n=1 Tax=Marasmius tenuissimus TaxID=585030 RepID=A0ABR2ZPR8_9AGAR
MQHLPPAVLNDTNSTFSLAQEDVTMHAGDSEGHEKSKGPLFDAERMGENSVDLRRARNPNPLEQETPNSEMNKSENEAAHLQGPQMEESQELAEVERLCLDNVDEDDIRNVNVHRLGADQCESSFGLRIGTDTRTSPVVDGGLMNAASLNGVSGSEIAGLDTRVNEANVTIASSEKRQGHTVTAPTLQLPVPIVKQEDFNSLPQTLVSLPSRSTNPEHHDTQEAFHKRHQPGSRARTLKQTTRMENHRLRLTVKERDTQLSKVKARLRTASAREIRFQLGVQRRDTRITKLVDEHTRTRQAFEAERTENEVRIGELDREVERLREEGKKAKTSVSRLTRDYRALEATHREDVVALARVRDELAGCEGKNKALNDALVRTREGLEAERARSQRYREERNQLDGEFEMAKREGQRIVGELEAARGSLADWSEVYDQPAGEHAAAGEAWRRERKEYKRLLAQRERELEDIRANLQHRKRHSAAGLKGHSSY